MAMPSSSTTGLVRLLQVSALVAASSYVVWVVRRRRRRSALGGNYGAKRVHSTQDGVVQSEDGAGRTPVSTPPPSSPSIWPFKPNVTIAPLDTLSSLSPQEPPPLSPCLSASQRSIRRSISEGPSSEFLERLRVIMGSLPGPKVIGRRRIELLVHNVSHKDMVLSMTDHPGDKLARTSEDLVLCRPRFSLFQPTSKAILSSLSMDDGPKVTATSPLSIRERELRDKAYTLKYDLQQPELPVGFDLSRRPLPVKDMSHFRFRRDGDKRIDPAAPVIDGVYFPLLASIIPKWCKAICEGSNDSPRASGSSSSRDDGVFKIVFLVSGIGMPRDPTSDATGNSTEGTCQLIEQWLKQHYPSIHVVRVHSVTNIFRYDENIAFVKTELLPLIEYYRDIAAERWGTEWRSKYRITISFADGSPARISAINASLRPYRPSFMHMWELKTFWQHGKMCLDDVELHSFEDIDTLPPVPVANADSIAQMVAEEMMKYREEVLTAFRQGQCRDLTGFWLRKTKKPVLAVLLVHKEGRQPVLYRGCNMEVSMPTGSLCAERNAIGSALAADLTLGRRDLKIVAVLSLSFKGIQRKGTAAVGDAVLSRDASLDVVLRQTSNGHHHHCAGEEARGGGGHMALTEAGKGGEGQELEEEGHGGGAEHAATSPPRVTIIRSYSVADMGVGGCADIRTISVDSEDLNPLKPCGACMEWLKKIAEKNPEFRVATFTDELCRGIYTEFISTEQS